MSDLAVDLSPAAPVEAAANGGKQSTVTCALDVVPTALLRVGRVLYDGEAKYEQGPQLVGQENWRLIPARMHARHALTHLVAWLAGDTTDAHLEHAAARALLAVEQEHQETPVGEAYCGAPNPGYPDLRCGIYGGHEGYHGQLDPGGGFVTWRP